MQMGCIIITNIFKGDYEVGKYRLKNSRRLLLLLADGVALSFACFCSYFLIDYLAVEAIPTRALLQAIFNFCWI